MKDAYTDMHARIHSLHACIYTCTHNIVQLHVHVREFESVTRSRTYHVSNECVLVIGFHIPWIPRHLLSYWQKWQCRCLLWFPYVVPLQRHEACFNGATCNGIYNNATYSMNNCISTSIFFINLKYRYGVLKMI